MFVSKIRAAAGDDRSPWGDFWFEPVSVRTSAGQHVSADSAMKLSAVYACVRVLAETMASLPFCLYRNKAGGGKERVTDHWLYQLLARRPNRWQNGFEWREMMQGHLALRGTAYNRIVPDNRGGVAELQPLHPDRMKIEMLPNGNYRYRLQQSSGGDELLAPGSVFKICGLSSNGLIGLNPIEVQRESIGEGLALQDFSSRFFNNDARPMGGWIGWQGKFADKPARDAWRESWQAAQSGENRGKTAVLEQGMEYHEIGLNNKDSQFVEARAAKVSDVARMFRVPPHLIGDLSKATFGNIEQQSLEFVTYTMTPWAERWEAAIEDQLLGDGEDLEVEFDFEVLLRGDQAARAEFYNSGITAGWLTRNEARARENLNPLPGLDEPLAPLNMAPAGSAGAGVGNSQDAAPADAARLQALEAAVAERVVRKEIAAVRKAGLDAARVREIYVKHAHYMQESLACSLAFAAIWCEAREAELVKSEDVGATLEAWEAAGAAELVARLKTDRVTSKKG
jgi:HK97 family phage portal protein